MNKIVKLFCDIGNDPRLFVAGWLSGMAGAIVGLLLARR